MWGSVCILLRYVNIYISAQDPDLLDPQDFGFLDPDPPKYADSRIRTQVGKYRPKTEEKLSRLTLLAKT